MAKKKTPVKELSVRAQMNALGVGESVEFSLLRYDYAVSCRQRLQLVTPKRFTSTIDQNTGVVIITRLEDKPE